MDITETIAPRSDQLNADDLIAGPRTVTVTAVTKGTPEQPVDIVTAEFGDGRPYKPSKSMRRVLVAAWGPEAAVYVGRRMTLYRDPDITFGPEKVGGIRISHLSDIAKPLDIPLTVKRGKRVGFKVAPMPPESAPVPAVSDEDVSMLFADIDQADTADELDLIAADLKARNLGRHHDALLKAWKARRDSVTTVEVAE